MSQQIPLDLGLKPNFSAAAFFDGRCNAEARMTLSQPQNWSNRSLALIGQKGCGKTHLGHIWATQNNAISLDGYAEFKPRADWKDRALWIDNAASADEFTVFTLINMAIKSSLSALLLTDRETPMLWSVQIPDLHSRLRNLQTVRLDEPSDDVLFAILSKLFKDRGLFVSKYLVSYLLTNTDRSVDALRALVVGLDQAAVAKKKKDVTRSFAAQYLKGNL